MTDDPLVRALKDTYGDDLITAHPVLGALVAERDRLWECVYALEGRERHLRDALADMRAERDRLRAAAEVFKDNALDVGTELERMKTERDRLRAVVDAAREEVYANRAFRDQATEADIDWLRHNSAATFATLAMRIDEFDGSPDE